VKKEIRKYVGGKRPGPGRPATGTDPARTIRLSDAFIAQVDAWAAAQDDEPGRSEAIRRLVEIGLKASMTHEDQRPIERRERYVGYATHCLELAKAAADQKSHTILREMAAEWHKLAENPAD
jgi:hypothetical protein